VRIFRVVVAVAFLAAAVAGFAVEGWSGAVLFPLALAVAALALAFAWFVAGVAVSFHGHQTRVSKLRARVGRLSTEDLLAVTASPAHPDYGFALEALARRGIHPAPPDKRLLLGMLESADAYTRAQGMSLLAAFYPEVRLPEGAA